MALRIRRIPIAALLCAPACAIGAAMAQPALPPSGIGGTATAALRVLSPEDVRRYRAIFEEEQSGHFAEARTNVAALGDDCLMGYVLAEHYLSPHSGHAAFKDLNDWLDDYGDLSIAPRIYKLAHRRARRRLSDLIDIPGFVHRGGGYEDVDLADPPPSSELARGVLPDIDKDVQNDDPADAEAVLNGLIADGSVPAADLARIAQRVAASYLAEGMDQQAYDLAVKWSGTSSAPMLYWRGGLAAYRLGKFADAAGDFEQLARVGSVPDWTRAAAAFWAARAHISAGDPLPAINLMQAAAREQPTFYGMLAERVLGADTETGFNDPVLNADAFLALMQNPAAHRAVALWQVGRADDVPNEMNRALASIDLKYGAVYAALARRMNLPNLELRASETAASRGQMLTGLFPVPAYAPDGGYRVDPSLVLAFARVESRFIADATSPAGAEGLMQIRPGTARDLVHGDPGDLTDPSNNLALGQRYLEQLLNQLKGNLIEVAAAYNAGPGSLTRWMGRQNLMADPLLFVESMPSPETRMYVKRLMMYHWLYARRMGRDAPSLDQAAEGEWPLYKPHDTSIPTPVADNAATQD